MKVRKRTWKSGGAKKYGWEMDYYHPVTKQRERPLIKHPETGLPILKKSEAETAAALIWANLNAKAKNSDVATEVDMMLSLKSLLQCHRGREGKSAWTIQIEEKQATSINRIWPDILVVSINSKALEDYAKRRRTEKERKRVANPATIVKELKLIRQAMRWGSLQGLCSYPAFVLPRLVVTEYEAGHLEPKSVELFFRACGDEDSYMRQVAEVLYYSGLRRGELFSLKWQNVNFTEKTLRLVTNKGGSAKDRKGDVVFLSDRSVVLLKKRKEVATCDYVFGVESGIKRNGIHTHEPFDIGNRLKAIAKKSDISLDVMSGSSRFPTAHSMRHSCGTNMFQADTKVPEIASHLRHRDGGALLLKKYAHAHETRLRSAVNDLEKLGQMDDPDKVGRKTVVEDAAETANIIDIA